MLGRFLVRHLVKVVPNTAKPLGKARGDEKGKGKEDDIGMSFLHLVHGI
jgi:hypothetical protein